MEVKNLNPIKSRNLYFMLAIFVIALAARVLFVAFYPVTPLAGGDPTAFWSFGQGVAAGRGFRSTFEPWLADRPPLYSYFLAGVFLLFGENRMTVFLAQAFVWSIAAGLFYLVAVRILDQRRAFVAGIGFALLPHHLLFTKQILTEAIYTPFLVVLLAVLVLPKDCRFERRYQWLLVGGVLGLVSLVRREALLPGAGIIAATAFLRMGLDWRRLVETGLLVVLTTALVLVPWLVRNWSVLGKPVMSSSGGVVFMGGNSPLAEGGYAKAPAEWAKQLRGLDELSRNEKAWEFVVKLDTGPFR